jgi:hypothetical protein
MNSTRTALLLVLALPVAAQQGSPGGGKRTTEQIVMGQERAVWEASKGKDVNAFKRLVAIDARMVFESGVLTRADYLEGLPDRTITNYQLSDFTVFQPNPVTAIVIYKANRSGVFKGKPFPPATVREASVWVNRAGAWVAVLNHETPMTQ